MNNSLASNDTDLNMDPKVILFQFWHKDMPESVEELTQGVAKINAGMDYLLFDDVSATEFIRNEFGTHSEKMYQDCLIPAMRADFFRYCFLLKRGGLYIDADFPANASMQSVIDSNWKGCLYLRSAGLTNSMMFFREAGNPLIEKIYELALYNISNRTSNNVWQVTGPQVLRSVQADDKDGKLFEGIHLMDEDEFSLYFNKGKNLDYKSDDSHWLVARQKGLKIFRD